MNNKNIVLGLVIVGLIGLYILNPFNFLSFATTGAQINSIKEVSYEADIGDTISILANVNVDKIPITDDAKTFALVIQPPNEGTVIYKRTFEAGTGAMWWAKADYTVTEMGMHKIALWKCDTDSCDNIMLPLGSKKISFEIRAPYTTPTIVPTTPIDETDTSAPLRPADTCVGIKLVTYEFHNNKWYPKVIDEHAVECGYVPSPSEPSEPLVPLRPADSCDGTTKITYTLVDNVWLKQITPLSPACGYVVESVVTQPPERCDGTTKVTYELIDNAWVAKLSYNDIECGHIIPIEEQPIPIDTTNIIQNIGILAIIILIGLFGYKKYRK